MKISDRFEAILWRSMSANNCNCYLINGSQRVLIDPGHRALFQHVEQGLKSLDLTVADIDVVLCTHAHPDHIESVQAVKKAGAKFGLHREEWQLVKAMMPHVTESAAEVLEDFKPDFFLQEGDLQLGDLSLEVFHTPGHSPGSVCFYSAVDQVLVTGDVIFKDGIGRTDLPGGNGKQLKQSLEKLSRIPAEFVLPGHGDIVSGQDQVKANHERISRMYEAYLG